MSNTYLPLQLVYAHLPCPPSIPSGIPELRVPSSRPFPQSAEVFADPLHPDHAQSSAYDPATGILARSIHNDYVLELRTLSSSISVSRQGDAPGSETVRIFFPDPLRPLVDSSITFSRQDGRLYILVVTQENVVYRLSFPVGGFKRDSGRRFAFTTRGDDWSEEYEVPEEVIAACGAVSAWHVVDSETVVLGGTDGGIIRLARSDQRGDVFWTAAHHRPSSRLRLPSLFSRSNSDEQVISFAKFEDDGSVPLLYALSQDRRIRTWNTVTGACLKTADIRFSSSSRDLVVRDSSAPSGSTSGSPETTSAQHIRVIRHLSSTSKYSHLVVAFVATPYSNTSAGTFVVYRGSSNAYGANDLVLAGEQPCSGYSIGCSLRGFEVIPSFTRDGVNTGWRLFVAWDRKGSIAAEVVTLDHLFQITPYVEPSHNNSLLSDWQPVSQGTEAEQFDAAYFDNLLGAAPPDSAEPYNNTDIGQTFLEHLFHPGRFSSLTLSTALDEYVQQLPRTHAIALASTSYPTLSRRFEAVVGCHLELELSPQTGAPVVEAYRQQLKLEWLGVWAAVRDLDRQARWPVTTTLIDGHVAIIAREGASVPVLEDGVGIINRLGDSQEASGDLRDLPDGALRHLYPDLAPPLARASMLALSAAGSFAVDILANRDAPNGEGSGLDLFVNEADLAFSTGPQQPAEFLAGQLWDDTAEQLLSDEDRMTLRRILSGCLDVRAAFGVTLHLISNFVLPLRGTLVSDLAFSGFGNSILASSISRVVENRYALARKVLLVALFSLTESADVIAEEGDEAEDMVEIVAQTMAAYHRMRVLKWVCDQTGEESKERAASRRSNKRKLNGGEDVLAEGLGSLNVREADEALDTDGYDVSYSLIHSLLARQSHQRIPRQSIDIYLETAIAYLSEISILEKKQTEIEPQVEDVRLAHAILVDDHPALAYGVTDLYPESAGMVYVRGRASVEQGDLDLAVRYLEKAAAGCKDGVLQTIVPSVKGERALSEYYRHIAQLLNEHGLDGPVAHFGLLAIRSTPPGHQASKDLWTRVFLANVAAGLYEDAYSVLTSTPYLDLKREFLGQLISVMCESNEVGRLNSLGFVGFQKDVESMLSFKARNSDPLRFPNYYKVLYSWHISRGDYRSAGEIMYLQGRRFAEGVGSRLPAFEVAAMQARSFLAAINALALVDKRNAWVCVPAAAPKALRGIKRKKVSSFVPEEEFTKEKRPVDIVTLSDIEREYALVLSHLRLSGHLHDLHEHGISVSPDEVVGLFVQQGMFDEAQSAAASLQVDMTSLFQALATRCVELSRLSDIQSDVSTAAFLQLSPLTNRLRGPPSLLALRYLQASLQRHDSPKTHYRYREAAADTFFEMNQDKRSGWQMPGWLVEWEMARDPEGWVGRALTWGWIEEAVDWSVDLLRKETPPELLPPKRADVADVPYTLIDRVVAAARDGPEKGDLAVQRKLEVLEEEVKRRIDGLQRL